LTASARGTKVRRVRRAECPSAGTSRRSDIAVYLYRCPSHGTTETRCAMGAAPAAVPCPACGAAAARVFTAPRLSFGDPVRRAVVERTERSRDHPDVVTAPPPVPGARRQADVLRNPALSRLPRP
jgi:putative FmdB family regulatory protein